MEADLNTDEAGKVSRSSHEERREREREEPQEGGAEAALMKSESLWVAVTVTGERVGAKPSRDEGWEDSWRSGGRGELQEED